MNLNFWEFICVFLRKHDLYTRWPEFETIFNLFGKMSMNVYRLLNPLEKLQKPQIYQNLLENIPHFKAPETKLGFFLYVSYPDNKVVLQKGERS